MPELQPGAPLTSAVGITLAYRNTGTINSHCYQGRRCHVEFLNVFYLYTHIPTAQGFYVDFHYRSTLLYKYNIYQLAHLADPEPGASVILNGHSSNQPLVSHV